MSLSYNATYFTIFNTELVSICESDEEELRWAVSIDHFSFLHCILYVLVRILAKWWSNVIKVR